MHSWDVPSATFSGAILCSWRLIDQYAKKGFLFLWRDTCPLHSQHWLSSRVELSVSQGQKMHAASIWRTIIEAPKLRAGNGWLYLEGLQGRKRNWVFLFFLPQISLNRIATGKGPRGRHKESIVKAHHLHVGGPQCVFQEVVEQMWQLYWCKEIHNLLKALMNVYDTINSQNLV